MGTIFNKNKKGKNNNLAAESTRGESWDENPTGSILYGCNQIKDKLLGSVMVTNVGKAMQ